MLDLKFIVDNLEAVKANCRNRNVHASLDQIPALHERRRRLIQEIDALKHAKRKPTPREQQALAEYKKEREWYFASLKEEESATKAFFMSFTQWLQVRDPVLAQELGIPSAEQKLASLE